MHLNFGVLPFPALLTKVFGTYEGVWGQNAEPSSFSLSTRTTQTEVGLGPQGEHASATDDIQALVMGRHLRCRYL